MVTHALSIPSPILSAALRISLDILPYVIWSLDSVSTTLTFPFLVTYILMLIICHPHLCLVAIAYMNILA